MLYQTGVEYGDYTMNHVQGCAHGCKYPCYAFLMKKRFGQIKDYDSWLEPVLVSNTLELLDKEIPRLRDKIQSVQLCFTTDPFMEGYPEVSQMSIAAIRKLNEAGIKCTTLTKGLLPIELSELSPENEYGITLITLDEAYREQMEPGAVPCADRLAALRALHEVGCKTWVSIEPYPTPNMIEQNLSEILEAVAGKTRVVRQHRRGQHAALHAKLRDDGQLHGHRAASEAGDVVHQRDFLLVVVVGRGCAGLFGGAHGRLSSTGMVAPIIKVGVAPARICAE